MDIKTKKIKELMNKNIGLEQKMNQLKIYYKSKENSNKKLANYKSSEMDYSKNNRDNDMDRGNEENYNKSEENRMISFEELSLDELHTIRNQLLKERNDITFLYNKLPIKLISKEEMRQKNELENKLTKVNNDLMKIRLQIKNFNQ